MAHILTGTWEQIKAHDAELAGRQLRVIVEDGEQKADSDDTSVSLAAFDAWVAAPRPRSHHVFDDSRSSIYGEDMDRG